MGLDHLLFLVMSLIWGATWIATKVGLAAVPPFFFGAARYILVSAVLLFVVRDLRTVFGGGRALRVIVSGALVVAATYAFIYWGMQYVASGVSGVVNMSMNPVCLFGLAILLGRSGRHGAMRWRCCSASAASCSCSPARRDERRRHGAVGRGRAGCRIALLLPRLGAVAPAARSGDAAATHRRAWAGRCGGTQLLSLAVEPVSGATVAALLTPAPLAGVLFLVIGGTFIAYTIFLRLMRDWGASRAGLYSFVSPVVALILGAIVFGEPLTWREIGGAAIMLLAAWIAVSAAKEVSPG